MAYAQTFRGVFELPGDIVVTDDDPEVQAVLEQLLAARTEGLVTIDIQAHQPAMLWDCWMVALSELAHAAVRGFVVAAFIADDIQIEVFAAGREPRPCEPCGTPVAAFADGNAWQVTGDVELEFVVRRRGDRLSIEQFEDEPYNDWLGTYHLRENGSAIVDYDDPTMVWLDLRAPAGSMWLRADETEVLRWQRCVGPSPASSTRTVYELVDWFVSTDPSDYRSELRTPQSIWIEFSHTDGIVRLFRDEYPAESKEPGSPPDGHRRPWWRFW